MENNLEKFEKSIGIDFNDKKLLLTVFVHRSYLNENVGSRLDHNERLEFLGDAVLELSVTEHLYKNYSNPEGELTNWRAALVRGKMLSEIAKKIEMDDHLCLSRGEQKSKGKARDLILANAFEALVGAIYLDQGYEKAAEFIKKYLLVNLPEILDKKLYLDSKSHLQELSQEQRRVTPVYKVLTEYGPDHNKSFSVGVYLGEKLIGEGSGSSKQIAEESAASNALENWDQNM